MSEVVKLLLRFKEGGHRLIEPQANDDGPEVSRAISRAVNDCPFADSANAFYSLRHRLHALCQIRRQGHIRSATSNSVQLNFGSNMGHQAASDEPGVGRPHAPPVWTSGGADAFFCWQLDQARPTRVSAPNRPCLRMIVQSEPRHDQITSTKIPLSSP